MTAATEVSGYEHDLARHLDITHVVAVSSGTAAIHTALDAVGVGPGDEVLVPALSVVMSAAPILHLGARPVVVDSSTDGTGFDLADLHAKTSPRSRAIVAVYLWGRADPRAATLAGYARDHGLAVVVDACQAVGTTAGSRQAGLDAAATCFSTHAQKILATGEGGFIATDDDQLAARARAYRSHWLPAPPGDTPLARAAHNFRLAEPLAAIGRRELTHLDALLEKRRTQTATLLDLISDVPGLAGIPAAPGWNGYAPLVRLDLARPRAFCEHLARLGVPNSTGTFGLVPLDQRPAFHDPARAPCLTAAGFLDSVLAVALTRHDDDPRIACYGATITEEAARWADA